MKKFLFATSVLLAFAVISCTNQREGTPKVLVFSKTMGFKHASIPAGITALETLGKTNGFEIDTTKNADMFTEENLKQYAAVVFLSTTGDVLNHYQEAAFERYIQAGGGFVGVHAAADTEYDWGWYNKLVGAHFLSHPAGTPNADFVVKNTQFPATSFFTDSIWNRDDEIYNYKKINPNVNVLLTVDESSYEGGENGAVHPFAWYHDFDGGRAFYTGAGHTDESYKEPQFLNHLLGGIQYAMADNAVLDYSKVSSQIPPDADRFSKTVMAEGAFFEPTEMTILPNSDVLIGQRRGEVLWYNNATNEITEVAKFNVYDKTLNTPDVNAEEGLMGIQKDPNYTQNNWVYVYYAPTGDAEVNRLSRFTFKDANFDMDSEQVILDVPSDREICCHTGGSIAFGPDNLLYLSTGDNSTPFDEKGQKYVNRGYAPLNDTPGHEQYDARRSSANTNDLRGKILRIKVKEDGTYEIPEGNLFPVGTAKTKPEIYTMGHRNPYRISVDPKKGYVYWGDVGPDARVDSLESRGPRGYDEMNQAREAGNFGWPLFVADNKPYRVYDYENGTFGEAFDPENPVNNSKNNTGLTQLPKAMPAYAFYPYDASNDFPQLGTGGRNAMAGPTYYSDLYQGADKLPEYYNEKVFIYDWMRGWIKALHLNEDGSFSKMEPFASDIKVNNLIDMEMGPDGKLYLLEYGSGWFSKNDNAALSVVEFNSGNRAPIIDLMIVDQTSGSLPLAITASVKAHDREKDELSYVWELGNGETKETSTPEISHTFNQEGNYKISVTVKDKSGAAAKSESVAIVAGNSRPDIRIAMTEGNSSFFIPGKKLSYEVSVTDADGAVNKDNIYVSVDYLDGMDKVGMSLGHQQVSAAVTGKALTLSMDCKTCHKPLAASIGPNYTDIAKKYADDKNAMGYLQKKIVMGGSGVWGEVTMPAHPDITSEESRQIALYILSLSGDVTRKKSLPIRGDLVAEAKNPGEVLVLTASYTDEGTTNAMPLTGTEALVLSSNTLNFPEGTETSGMQAMQFSGMELQLLAAKEGWVHLKDIDLKGVGTIGMTMGWQEAPKTGYAFELRLNAPDGRIIGTGKLDKPNSQAPGGMAMITLSESISKQSDLYITYAIDAGAEAAQVALMSATFN